MADVAKRKSGGAKTTRSETVTVRLDPELRYLAEIAARTQRRTLSSYIDWAIQKSLDLIQISPGGGDVNDTIASRAKQLWDVDEPDRFVKLALIAPELLNYDEQRLWKLIRDNGYLWDGWYEDTGKREIWTWKVSEGGMRFDRLREHWSTFVGVAKGELPYESLPTWEKEKVFRHS